MVRFVEMFEQSGHARCPTCLTPTENLAEHIANTKTKDLPAITAQLADVSAKLEAAHKAVAAYAKWEKIEHELVAREAQLQEAESKLVDVTPPQLEEEDLQRTVNEYEEFQRAKTDLVPIIQATREQQAKLSGTLDALRAQKVKLSAKIDSLRTAPEIAESAGRRITELRGQLSARQALEQQKNQLLFSAQHLQLQLDQAAKNEKTAVRIRSWSAVAEQARDALKQAPRLVAQRNLLRLESAINDLLRIFAVNFLVKVADDGSPTFVAEFFDGRKQAAQRLSIGQKTVLALAFRVAVNAMFAEEIGLLALDEPTASLDAARIKALAPVLEKLRDLSTSKGLQCLLVTHAMNLSHLFESTIELEPPELRNVPQS